MQPFVAAGKVKDAYWRYIETSFPIRGHAPRWQFRRLVEEHKLLWQEPFISLSRPFKIGGSFDSLIAAGVLDIVIGCANRSVSRVGLEKGQCTPG